MVRPLAASAVRAEDQCEGALCRLGGLQLGSQTCFLVFSFPTVGGVGPMAGATSVAEPSWGRVDFIPLVPSVPVLCRASQQSLCLPAVPLAGARGC